jgi:hypothetical protein
LKPVRESSIIENHTHGINYIPTTPDLNTTTTSSQHLITTHLYTNDQDPKHTTIELPKHGTAFSRKLITTIPIYDCD